MSPHMNTDLLKHLPDSHRAPTAHERAAAGSRRQAGRAKWVQRLRAVAARLWRARSAAHGVTVTR
ncbi:hypothetical protein LCL97_13670 [Seohaeicola saemankumensis]|nr:hypothetical protein [Seohaeicola saemankumensis]MCA0871882.1 hypothetical protein [Seohaeicola saemankumensis]